MNDASLSASRLFRKLTAAQRTAMSRIASYSNGSPVYVALPPTLAVLARLGLVTLVDGAYSHAVKTATLTPLGVGIAKMIDSGSSSERYNDGLARANAALVAIQPPRANRCDASAPCDENGCPYCDPVGFHDDNHSDLRINGRPA